MFCIDTKIAFLPLICGWLLYSCLFLKPHLLQTPAPGCTIPFLHSLKNLSYSPFSLLLFCFYSVRPLNQFIGNCDSWFAQ